MLICAQQQDAANGPGKWFSADCCEALWPHPSSLVFWACVAGSGRQTPCSVWLSLGALTWPPLGWRQRCRVLVGALGSPWWCSLHSRMRGRVSCSMPAPTATRAHPRGHSLRLDAWNLVLRCWLWDFSHWEPRCVSFMTRSLFTVSPCICITPRSCPFLTLAVHMPTLHHNENTQVVPGGETVEGECAKSLQGHVWPVIAIC